MEKSFLWYIEQSIKDNWNLSALTDFKGTTSSYKDVARKIEKLHILFENSGLKRGDKIALCGRNSSNWGIAFMAGLTYGAVVVPILNDFKPDSIHHIVNHSEVKILFAGEVVLENLDENRMKNIAGILRMEDYSLYYSNSKKLEKARRSLNELFGKKYPDRFTADDVKYKYDKLDDIALINYTSGTTSSSKGVILSYRSLWANLTFAKEVLDLKAGERVVSMLPMAHMYGLMFEFIYEFSIGMHVHFLSRTPSPKIIAEAFAAVKPDLIITVPLVIEKIIKKRVFPMLEKPHIKLLMSVPFVNDKIRETIRKKVIDAFGGQFKELIIGGAALNKDVEKFLNSISFPYTVGYGMTECGPIIAYSGWKDFKLGSCGRAIMHLELKIDSSDQANIPGEILTRGACVMNGYYKNEEASTAALDKDGWLHTGDMGIIDEEGNLFIKGRSKNMILGPSGQNIYPEELEDSLNNTPYVNESLVVEKDGRLIALIYPDYEMAHTDKISDAQLKNIMDENLKLVNKEAPSYSQLASFKLYSEEFEKTPKRSIKRFLYQ